MVNHYFEHVPYYKKMSDQESSLVFWSLIFQINVFGLNVIPNGYIMNKIKNEWKLNKNNDKGGAAAPPSYFFDQERLLHI